MSYLWIYVVALFVPLIIYILSVFYKLVQWFLQIRKIQAAVDRFAVLDRHWLYGHMDKIPELDEKGILKLSELTERSYKGAFPHYIGIVPILVLCHSDTAKIILKTTEPKGMIAATGSGYKLLIPWLGDSLLNSKGKKWSRNRKLLTPGFHFEILKSYVQIYNQCVSEMIYNFAGSCCNGGSESIEIMQHISLCTLKIMRKCAFSAIDDEEGSSLTYLKAVNEITELILERTMNPLHYFDDIYALTQKGRKFHKLCSFTHGIADDIIHKRRQQLNCMEGAPSQTNKCYVDFLDKLLLARDEDGKGLTDLEIRDEVVTFMFAGHDTTACAVSWILYNLALHPQIQKQAQEEIDQLFQNKSIAEVEWDDFNDIPYLTRCIKESMRLYPPVPFADRELSKPIELIDGHILPAGTVVAINVYTIHHNPRIWGEDHMVYNPDRFLPGKISHLDSYAFIPFSAGPRNCIGQVFAMNQVKTTIIHVLHRFNLLLDKEHKIEMKPGIVLRAKYGIKLFFEERVKTN